MAINDPATRLAGKINDIVDSKIKKRVKNSSVIKSGKVVRIDSDGMPWVAISGSDQETPVNGEVLSSVKIGASVSVTIENGKCSVLGNADDPSIGSNEAKDVSNQEIKLAVEQDGVIGRVIDVETNKVSGQIDDLVTDTIDPVKASLDELYSNTRENVRTLKSRTTSSIALAEEAKGVAEAMNQHFWYDDGGAHVTEVTQEEWNTSPSGFNSLFNSLGLLLRRALNNIAAFTHSAVTFFDGNGNEASNITASFGSNEAVVGSQNTARTIIKPTGMTIVNRQDYSIFEAFESDTASSMYVEEIFNCYNKGLGFIPECEPAYEIASGTDISVVISAGEAGASSSIPSIQSGVTLDGDTYSEATIYNNWNQPVGKMIWNPALNKIYYERVYIPYGGFHLIGSASGNKYVVHGDFLSGMTIPSGLFGGFDFVWYDEQTHMNPQPRIDYIENAGQYPYWYFTDENGDEISYFGAGYAYGITIEFDKFPTLSSNRAWFRETFPQQDPWAVPIFTLTMDSQMAVRYYTADFNPPIFSLGSRNVSTTDGSKGGAFSAIIGENLIADNPNQIVVGKNNMENASSAFTVGWGDSPDSRENILDLDTSGNLSVCNGVSMLGDLSVSSDSNLAGDLSVSGDSVFSGNLSGTSVELSNDMKINNASGAHFEMLAASGGASNTTIYDVNGDPVWRLYFSEYGSLARQEYVNGAWDSPNYYILRENVNSLFTATSISQTIGSVAAGSTKTLTFSAAKTNYTPIAISGWYMNGASGLYPYMLRLSGSNIQCYVRNPTSSASSSTATVEVQVLYCKSSW